MRHPLFAVLPLALFVLIPVDNAPEPNVDVTPDGAGANALQYTVGNTAVFTVTNNSGYWDNMSLACYQSGQVYGCSSASSVDVPPYAGVNISVTYNTSGAGSGVVGLSASSGQLAELCEENCPPPSDDGSYAVTVTPPAEIPAAPLIALPMHNGDHVDRSLCLTLDAGEAAAVQCGDLLIEHAMPAYRTIGRDRALALLYNSATAVPKPVVAAVITQPGNMTTPTSVVAELRIGGVARARGTFSPWSGGEQRQVVLAYDAPGDSTGIYNFDLVVTNNFPSSSQSTTYSGMLLLVNRANSEFGAGWALAGIERLVLNQPGSRILWVGGDGSAVAYASAGTNAWAAAPAAFQDTIVWDGTYYTRRERHGVRVLFDAQGRHAYTINRTNHQTQFSWGTPPNYGGQRLLSIKVPPNGDATTYSFVYEADGTLNKILDPVNRVLDVAMSSGKTTAISDPDNAGVSFEYHPASARIKKRINRRGYATWFQFYSGLRVMRVSIPYDAIDFSHTDIDPWDQKGLVSNFPSGFQTPGTVGAPTKVDGPYPPPVTDTTFIWVDRFGAPTKIKDPLSRITEIERTDAAHPALVTRVLRPDGGTNRAVYNARGNLSEMYDDTHDGTGSTQSVVTRYFYNDSDVPDSPTEIRTPVDTTRVWYAGWLGVPWVIEAPGGHRTYFTFHWQSWKYGLVLTVRDTAPVVSTSSWTESPQALLTTFDYDTWGNLASQQSPSTGLTTYQYDGYRRVQHVWDPMNHRTDYAYDLLNRVTSQTQYDDASLNGPKLTRYYYSATGQLDSVLDPRNIKRSWSYDVADRPVSETNDMGVAETRGYDLGGLLRTIINRTGDHISYSYDLGAQLTKIKYPSRVSSVVTVPGDSILRTYDPMGRVVTAQNKEGTITFTYNREGTVRTEQQQAGSLNFTTRYWYDAGNRRTRFFNGVDTITYHYGSDALVDTMKVRWMTNPGGTDVFRFRWDALGRRDSVIYPNGTRVGFGYDADGSLRMICSQHPAGPFDDYLDQRVRYTGLDADGMVLSMVRDVRAAANCSDGGYTVESMSNATYDGRHQALTQTNLGMSSTFQYDASGNLTRKQVGGVVDRFVMPWYSNRLGSRTDDAGTPLTAYGFDANGWRESDMPAAGDGPGRRDYHHDALGRMTGDGRYVNSVWTNFPNTCAYDALGRRILGCGTTNILLGFDQHNTIRAKGSWDWRFVHGPGTDDPLVGVAGVAGTYQKYYYLTDGRGRQLAFTNEDGYDYTGDLIYTTNGGNQAGGITLSNGFANARATTADVPHLSFYRNRYYDQNTGRWTQEDPIGIAGGVNLYQYSGNNPAVYTDPFGLCGPLTPACLAGAALAARLAASPAGQRVLERGSQLARNLAQSGAVRRAGEAAHHIVAKAAAQAQPAREALQRVGVQIDEAVNGVFLPAVRGAVGQAANHLYVHTTRYYEAVNQAVANVQTRQEAVEALGAVRTGLQNGTFPR